MAEEGIQAAVAEGGAYEVIRGRLESQADAVTGIINQLNRQRLDEFGETVLEVVGRVRVRTENNCVARDIVRVGPYLLFGYNVFIGLKKETQVSDVFSLYQLSESDGNYAIAAVPQEGTFLADPAFTKEFVELYAYYKNTKLIQLTHQGERLFAVFQIGNDITDRRVFQWQVDKDGAATYIDNRGERAWRQPASHDFEWTAVTRANHIDGAYPHISILDEVFVECVGGSLSIKVENNTATGLAIYDEPVDDADQSLGDADIEFARLGQVILLKILPYRERVTRYFVFNCRNQQVNRIDEIGEACLQLPEDHGIIFPGGYYLENGETKSFPDRIAGLQFKRQIRSPNGEDVLFIFYEPIEGACGLYSYNLIRKALQNPIYGHGYSLYGNGDLVIFSAEGSEASRNHAMQIWQTPYFDEEHAASIPDSGSFISKIGNKELVRAISDISSLIRKVSNTAPSRLVYEDLNNESRLLFDNYFWLEDDDARGLGGALRDLEATSELVIDEFDKVEAISSQAAKLLQDASDAAAELAESLDSEGWSTPEEFVKALTGIRKHRGQLISLREQRYIDMDVLRDLEASAEQMYDEMADKTATFLARQDAMSPYHQVIEQVLEEIEAATLVTQIKPLVDQLDETAEGIDLIMEIMNSLSIEDTTVRTRILDDVTAVYGQLNQARAKGRNRLRSMSSAEAEAEFGAQFRLFSQSIGSAITLVDTPEKADEHLARLLIQLEELESKFSDYDEFLGDILTKREELHETFEERKQALIEERQRRAHNIATAADRILTSIERRSAAFSDADDLNAFYSSDPMLSKLSELIGQLRELDDQVRADDIDSRLKAIREQAVRILRDRLDIYEDGGSTIKLGQHRFSVNSQELDLTMLARDDGLVLHLIGTDYFSRVDDETLGTLSDYWQQNLPSENANVYRSEYLAYCVMDELDGDDDIEARVGRTAAARYQDGYERGVHDHDATKIVHALTAVRTRAGLLRFGPRSRALGLLFWGLNPHNEVRRDLWCRHARSALKLSESLGSDAGFVTLKDELLGEIDEFVTIHGLDFSKAEVTASADYLSRELSSENIGFVVSHSAQKMVEGVGTHMSDLGHKTDFHDAIADYGKLNLSTRSMPTQDLERMVRRSGLNDQWALTLAWMTAVTERDNADRHFMPEACALMICDQAIEYEAAQVELSITVDGLLGEHPRIHNGTMTIVLDEFEERLADFAGRVQPEYRQFLALKQDVLERARGELQLDDFKARPLSSFVRNKLIDEVYLPIIGDNLAKQMGTIGDARRTDLMGLLLLISPPGYGKTTLMEYVADRLGLVFMKINCPSLGHEVTSIDPGTAPNSAARQEIEKINLAFEMGSNVMLYLDDIQHTNPEFLQKFISLCDGTRRIDGVWQDKAKTYDLRGKKFCVIMAGNPYTESGEVFKIPDMLANRADIYNLGDVLSGRERQFALSFIENALTSNVVLNPLALRDLSDVYHLVDMASGGDAVTLSHDYSSAELNELTAVLLRLTVLRDIVLKVNEAYIESASQADEYRTEPAFKLQGSYRNMNKMVEKVSSVMNEDELMSLIDDHYRGEAQTLTTGTEQNLLKLGELRGNLSEDDAARWEDIKISYQRLQTLGGDDQDAATKVVNQISHVATSLNRINGQMAGLDTSELAKPIQALTRVLLDAQSEKQHEQEQPVDTTAQDTVREIEKLVMALESKEFSFIHQTDPQLVALVTSLTAALEKKLEPVLQSIENRALIDLDIWERLKNLAGDIAELRGQAPDD